MASLYRLPIKAYETSFPVLLADGAVAEDEVLTLGRCLGLIEEINRGLDNAASANMAGQDAKMKQEYDRNLLKACNLIGAESDDEPLIGVAQKLIDEKLFQEWWKLSK